MSMKVESLVSFVERQLIMCCCTVLSVHAAVTLWEQNVSVCFWTVCVQTAKKHMDFLAYLAFWYANSVAYMTQVLLRLICLLVHHRCSMVMLCMERKSSAGHW
jgi:hypothetical protein